MNEVQLYINGTKADLFPDENISITSSIQNSSDISKIFTDFSQTFNLPASPTNNKLFKHYYNPDIALGFNFDARQKVDAIIELNFAHFRSGKLRLDGVQIKQGKPEYYRVTFFGSTVTLPDLTGEDLLSDLTALDAYDHEYSEDNVKTGFTSSLLSGNIVYPLITHTKRLFYDSSSIEETGGNLYYDASKPERGVAFSDLKPAIKLSAIIDAIEQKYGLVFDSDFIDGTLEGYEDVFPNLFLWLHAKKGSMQTAEGEVTSTLIKNFSFDSGTEDFLEISPDGSTFTFDPIRTVSVEQDFQATLRIQPIETGDYTINIFKNNNLFQTYSNVNGDYTTPIIIIDEPCELYIKIETEGGITNYDATLSVEKFETDPRLGRGGLIAFADYVANNQSVINTVSIRDNIPNIKVIDFLTNLFRMFNLTAYVKQTGQIYVEPLDEFYKDGKTLDISQYINNDTIDVNRAIPYKNIRFEFAEQKTFFAEKRNQIFGGVPFGSLVSQDIKYDGGNYSVKVDFEKMVYERITDLATNSLTDIGWGWSVDYKGDSNEDIEKASSVVGKPLIFFNVNTTNSTPISFYGATHSSISDYNRPSNVNENGTQTLNFNAEIDEFTLEVNNNSIYARYYLQYMTQVFDPKARKYRYKAKLPNRLLLNYSINDTFIIGDREYIINTVKSNVNTGDCDLELINKLF